MSVPGGINHWLTPKTCEICQQSFMAKDCRGRFCKTCVPDGTWLSIAQHYGLSKAAYELLVEAQGNRCKICGVQPTGSHHFKRLHVDHNHITGEVRGLLCPKCNSTVGFVETHDNIDEVVAYLKRESRPLRLVG